MARGAAVLGTYSTSSELAAKLSSQYPPGTLELISAPLISASSSAALIASTVRERFPSHSVDILVLNASISALSPLSGETEESLSAAVAGNIIFPTLLVKELLPLFSRTGTGRIIAISSEGAKLSRPNTSSYSATKAALESLVRTWSKELGREYGGLTANAVAPGLVATELWEGLPSERKAFWEKQAAERTVGGRIGTTEDVAGVVGWLAGDESKWVTGTTVAVNGGMFDI